jgi:hypothetical protein
MVSPGAGLYPLAEDCDELGAAHAKRHLRFRLMELEAGAVTGAGYGENALEAIGQMSDDPLIGLLAVARRSSRPVPENAATKPSVTPGGHDGSRRPIQLVPEARRSVVHI